MDDLTYIQQLCRHRRLTKQEVASLTKRAQDGDQTALDELIKHNYQLVFWWSKYYHKFGPALGDLFQVGVIGLMRAAKKYVVSKAAFSTYASWFIRCEMLQLVREQRLIHVPSYHYEFRDGRVPNRYKKRHASTGRSQPKHYEDALRVVDSEIVSIDAEHYEPEGDGIDNRLRDLLPGREDDPAATSLEEDALAERREALLQLSLLHLTPREQVVLWYRHFECLEFEEIGQRLNPPVTRQRVQQIDQTLICKLKRAFTLADRVKALKGGR